MFKMISAAVPLCLALAAPALADPTGGIGLTFAFGGGKMETGVGLRLFSDDRKNKFVGAVGFDYMFQSQRIRPAFGAAYLGKNSYVGLDLGFGLSGGGMDVGMGLGFTNTDEPAGAAAPAPGPGPILTMPAQN